MLAAFELLQPLPIINNKMNIWWNKFWIWSFAFCFFLSVFSYFLPYNIFSTHFAPYKQEDWLLLISLYKKSVFPFVWLMSSLLVISLLFIIFFSFYFLRYMTGLANQNPLKYHMVCHDRQNGLLNSVHFFFL